MWPAKISLTIVLTIVASYHIQQHFSKQSSVDCDPMFFFGPPEVINQPQPQQIVPLTSSILAQQEVHIDSGSNEQDEYLLLTDEEVLNNAQILRFLAGASKEEVEEILQENPTIREKLYDRIHQIVEKKQNRNQSKPDSIIHNLNDQQQQQQQQHRHQNQHRHQHQHQQHQQLQQEQPMEEAHVQLDGQLTQPVLGMPNVQSIASGIGQNVPKIAAGAIGIGVLKTKFKPKFAKLIKIGGKLKKKILPLLKKKKKGKKKKKKVLLQGLNYINNNNNNFVEFVDDDLEIDDENEQSNDNHHISNSLRPRFHFNVSTSSRQLLFGN